MPGLITIECVWIIIHKAPTEKKKSKFNPFLSTWLESTPKPDSVTLLLPLLNMSDWQPLRSIALFKHTASNTLNSTSPKGLRGRYISGLDPQSFEHQCPKCRIFMHQKTQLHNISWGCINLRVVMSFFNDSKWYASHEGKITNRKGLRKRASGSMSARCDSHPFVFLFGLKKLHLYKTLNGFTWANIDPFSDFGDLALGKTLSYSLWVSSCEGNDEPSRALVQK